MTKANLQRKKDAVEAKVSSKSAKGFGIKKCTESKSKISAKSHLICMIGLKKKNAQPGPCHREEKENIATVACQAFRSLKSDIAKNVELKGIVSEERKIKDQAVAYAL